MKYTLLLVYLVSCALMVDLTRREALKLKDMYYRPAAGDRCRTLKFRCELRCNQDTRGATMSRIKCYDRCSEDEQTCRAYGPET